MSTFINNVRVDEWFAWYPVRCQCGTVAWMKKVDRVTDYRPILFNTLALMPTTTYFLKGTL